MASSFYPRHPRGWRPARARTASQQQIVSIHATLAGGDGLLRCPVCGCTLFLSTPPSRVATLDRPRSRPAFSVSIHATLTGGDCREGRDALLNGGFYPRHPHGWRRQLYIPAPPVCAVSIHATLTGGDLSPRAFAPVCLVSIHATLTGGDPHGMVLCRAGWGFYPRHPHGWRRFASSMPTSILLFLSTSPSRVATNGQDVVTEMEIVSIHATLTGGDNAPN